MSAIKCLYDTLDCYVQCEILDRSPAYIFDRFSPCDFHIYFSYSDAADFRRPGEKTACIGTVFYHISDGGIFFQSINMKKEHITPAVYFGDNEKCIIYPVYISAEPAIIRIIRGIDKHEELSYWIF